MVLKVGVKTTIAKKGTAKGASKVKTPVKVQVATADDGAQGCRIMAKHGECKWCAKGECWGSGQIEKDPNWKPRNSKGKGKGKGGKGGMWVWQPAGKGGWGGQQFTTFKVDKSGGELGEHTGTIKLFLDRKHYGFIECEDLAAEYGDIFLHGDMKKGYKQGHTVKFDCVINAKGKAVAVNLKSGLK